MDITHSTERGHTVNVWCWTSFLNVPFSMDSRSLYVPFSTRRPCSSTAIWSEITTSQLSYVVNS